MSFNPLLPVLDVAARYLPSSLSTPLYTLASFDLASLRDHPSQLLPLFLSLLAAYTALLSTLSTLRFALRTSVFLAKWGALGALGGAAYMAYQGAGTDRGAAGGVQDAAKYATLVGRGVYSLGRKGAGYYFGGGAPAPAAARAKRSSSGGRKTAAPVGGKGWDDGRDTSAEEFVSSALGGVLEFLNPGAGSAQEKVKRTAKRAAAAGLAGNGGGGGGGIGGFAWDLAMGRAQKAWDEVVGGAEDQGKKNNKKRSW
ncbi:hypothetical protein JCM10450v2_005767 [Rhodotorula kratochvilovae]